MKDYRQQDRELASRRFPGQTKALARWGIVLAGGDGVRLKGLTEIISGDSRPKQFCPLFGGRTLLEDTMQRTEAIIPAARVIVSLAEEHSRWYLREAAVRPAQRIVQPANRGTAPAIAHSLLSINAVGEDAVAAIFPSDHHYAIEPVFRYAVESAFDYAQEYGDSIVLLGAQAEYPETGYGWIEPGSPAGAPGVFRVDRFREKPPLEIAEDLLARGAVWNTFVMVGKVSAFLELLESSLPDLMSVLKKSRLWEGRETHIGNSVYQSLPASDLSRHVLSQAADSLVTLRMGQAGWSDLGEPERVLAMACASGAEPDWAWRWKRRNRADRVPFPTATAVA